MPSLANRNYIEECIRDDMYGVFGETTMCGCIGSINILVFYAIKKFYRFFYKTQTVDKVAR